MKKYDRKEIVRLYLDEGLHVGEIAALTGALRSTIYRNLHAAKVELRADHQAPKVTPRETCLYGGHPLEGDNVRVDKRGKRNCVTCERRRWLIYDAIQRD